MEHKKRYTRLLETARGLGAAGDMDKYLQSILSAAIELTNSDSAFILEFDEAAKDLTFSVVPWFQRDALQGFKIPLEGTAEGEVYLKCRSLAIGDVSADIRHVRQIDRLAKIKTKSLLAVPLVFRGVASGVLEVRNKAENGHYTEDDVAVLEMLAGLASMAMRNDILERRLQGSANEISELDRLKNEFIAITSHELRTPLGLILGHATFLREMLGQQYDEQLEAIIRNAARLKEIIESLSNVNNYQSGAARLRQRKVSITRVVEDVVASFHEMAKQKGVKLKKELAKADLLVDADGAKIAIALSNLVKNAITFTDKGGQVLVKSQLASGYLQVSVIDNGVGIPARDMPRVFERFFQVESHLTRRHGGMGLGLSVAKVMIEMHGGRIWAESVEGKGSNFTFVLPLNTSPVDKATEQPFIT